MAKPRNPFEHHHGDHDDDHDHHHDHGVIAAEELDPAQQSLADALRWSFTVLKWGMVLVIVFYLFSNVFSVPSGYVAVRLRFGEVVGDGRDQVIQAGGLHFAFPYPIEEVILIKTSSQQIALSKEFWWEQQPNQPADAPSRPLKPDKDGSLLTGDANIVHARWTLTYGVSDPVAFAMNVGDHETANNLVRAATEEGVVLAIAQSTLDDVMRSTHDKAAIRMHAQATLDEMHTGLVITDDISLKTPTIPGSVRQAYEAVLAAESQRGQAVEMATADRNTKLSETAGAGQGALSEMIRQYDLASTANDAAMLAKFDSQLDLVFTQLEVPAWAQNNKLDLAATDDLWDRFRRMQTAQSGPDLDAAKVEYAKALDAHEVPIAQRPTLPVSGKVAEVINEANSSRSTAVADVEREATIFRTWFDVYKNSPDAKRIVMARIWQEAKAEILNGDVETWYAPPGQLEIWLGRDPAVARKREEDRMKQAEDAKRQAAMDASKKAPTQLGTGAPAKPPGPPMPKPAEQHENDEDH